MSPFSWKKCVTYVSCSKSKFVYTYVTAFHTQHTHYLYLYLYTYISVRLFSISHLKKKHGNRPEKKSCRTVGKGLPFSCGKSRGHVALGKLELHNQDPNYQFDNSYQCVVVIYMGYYGDYLLVFICGNIQIVPEE